MGRPRGRVIAVKNEGIHKHRTNSIMSTIMPPQPRCSYRNSLYIHVRSKQARRNRTCTCTYVRHRKQVSIYCARSGFLFVRCVRSYSASLLFRIVPSHSCLIHSGDCAWCRQGEHGPLGRVLITLNLPLGLAATERRIPTRPPILPALYEGDPLPA